MSIEGYAVISQCLKCGFHTKVPIGDCDPKQHICPHHLTSDPCGDALVCRCGLRVQMESLFAAGYVRSGSRYDRRVMTLTDELTTLKDENTSILAENAKLRREIERLMRKR